MKEYFINVHYDAVVSVRVEAETEEEALDMAEDIAAEQEFDDVFFNEACVTDVNELEG